MLIHDPQQNIQLVVSHKTHRVVRMRVLGANEDEWVIIQYDEEDVRPESLQHRWFTMNLEYNGNEMITSATLLDSNGKMLDRRYGVFSF